MERFLTRIGQKIQMILFVIMSIFLILAVVNEASAQNATLRNVKKDQEWYSFERWRKDQPKVRIQQVKYAVQVSNENSKESRANQRLNRKIEAIRQRIK